MYLPTLPPGVTSVLAVRLYEQEDRSGDPTGAPVALVDGQWHADTLNVPAGRWWATVDAMKGATPYSYPLHEPVDLPEDDRLVVSPETLAEETGISLPLTSAQRRTITNAILSAQSDVQRYLGQPLTPQTFTQRGLWATGDEWLLTAHGDGDVLRVVSATPEVDADGVALGSYTVTYVAGLDARTDPALDAIKRYVMVHAINLPSYTEMWRVTTNAKGAVRSVSAEGQSVSFATPTLGGGGGKAGSGEPGALPTLSSLDFWRVAGRRVHQGATQFGRRYL